MAYEMRDNSGSLFKNEDRQKDTHANARGSAVIDGVHYFMDAWTKDGEKGKWQSLSFKKKDKQPGVAAAPKPPAGGGSRAAPTFADEGSDIPF